MRLRPDRHDQKTSTPAAKAETRTGMPGPRTAGRVRGESGIGLPRKFSSLDRGDSILEMENTDQNLVNTQKQFNG